ncbi:BrnT family toxin [Sphingomonas sp. DT-51]|uniref:BrnT family toxin n=1 Tax=Sphingomonas sp. DT-51 TaxID=3396165 RepID=UPI003F1A1F10
MFVFDAAKSAANRLQHGIDVPTAQALWHGPQALRIPVTDRHWASRAGSPSAASSSDLYAVATERDERTRIISVPRATPEQASVFERADEQ